jgi:hypothetical protein
MYHVISMYSMAANSPVADETDFMLCFGARKNTTIATLSMALQCTYSQEYVATL